ncbi:hypothetical protein PV396_34280 [Streptomyces sp. ME02-8801-2C]|uniref:hypothetical protein n=1 Tax=Streptomyces sp. ME02-8801-2C TaxID=3028680 RepID=UPI0029ADA35A|nr:hypothetical protein [Streptomyces sp. ME02-8801-2C]MDX3456962.1 hypothetical protein [Streptomyces sp. ME02-8801-2C]
MKTPAFVLHDSVNDPQAELWFAQPAGFTDLPFKVFLSEPGSPAADNLRAAVAPFLDSAPNELVRQQFIANVASGQQLLGALHEVGTVHCSIGLHRDDVDDAGANIGQPLLSFFTISWRDTAVSPRGVTAARAVTSAVGHTRIEFLELPCGPATLSESTLSPPAESGLSQQPLLQVHAHLPHPDCKRMAVLTVSTTAVARRAEYRGILQQIAETVSFENPLDFVTSEDR